MRSIPVAMTWEMLQRGRWSLIAGFLGAQVLPSIVFTAFGMSKVNFNDPSLFNIHATLVLINMFVFAAAVFSAQGSPSRLYTVPIPTSTLVAWHLFPAMAIVSIEMLLSTALLNAVFGLSWPLWGPALFVAAAVGAIQATLWLTEKSAWGPLAVSLITAVFGTWYHSRFGRLFSPPTHLWVTVTPVEVATFLAVALASFFVGTVAIARNRCGEQLQPLGIYAWFCRAFDFAPQDRPPFRNLQDAQKWFEWRKKGWVMPGTVILGLFFGLVAWLIFVRDPKELVQGLLVGGGLLSAVAMIGGIVIGNVGPNDSNYEIGHFLATRPMTSPGHSRIILTMTAKSVLFAWAIWAGSFLVVTGILFATGSAPNPFLPSEILWWYFPATLLGCWTVVAVLASFALAGRATLFAQLACSLFALYLAGVCFAAFTLSHEAQQQFFRGFHATCGIAFLMGTAWLYVVARRQSVIGWSTVIAGVTVWGGLTAAVVLEWVRHPVGPFPTYVFVVGLAALAVAPFAAAPVALSWNRNR